MTKYFIAEIMTDPWEVPEPVIIYRDREPEPKVEYDREGEHTIWNRRITYFRADGPSSAARDRSFGGTTVHGQ